jgi:hypothetical protein
MITRRAWAVLALFAVACSAPPSFIGLAGSDAGAVDAGPSAATACADLASAECAELEICAKVLLETRYGSVPTCESRLGASCTRSLGAPSTGNTARHAEACAQKYTTWSCADYLSNADLPAACTPPTGTLPSGSACSFAAQCRTGFCAIAQNVACGTCAPSPAVGDSCASLSTCGAHLLCLPGARVCGTLGAPGAECSKDAPCGAHLSCIGARTATGVPGRCQSSATASGIPCDPTLAKGPGCDYDGSLVCNGQTKTCEPLTISPAGGPCDLEDHQFATCAADGRCNTNEAGATGSCSAAAADGEACSAAGAGPSCLPPARCIVTFASSTSGTCQPDGTTACK